MEKIVRNIDEILLQKTSHGIGTKQVLIANDETDSAITQIARSRLKAGETVDEHRHLTMDEHFICLSGKGYVCLDGERIEFVPNTYVLVPAESMHHLVAETDMIFFTIGVATK
ncbi:MAG: cupin domain-containing protein [Prevotella sp.]|nr:cupin domain-containing protein [Prevotella sp.]